MPPEPAQPEDYWVTAPCALLQLDRNLTIQASNGVAQEWTGRSGDELRARRLSALFSVGGRIYVETQLASMLSLHGDVSELAVDLVRADGTRVPVLLNAALCPPGGTVDGGGAWAQVAMMSAADRRRYERDLRSARDDAERAAAEAARMQRRLALQADVSAAIAQTTDVTAALGVVGEVIAAEFGDWCLLYLAAAEAMPEEAGLVLAAAEHNDVTHVQELRELAESLPRALTGDSAVRRSMQRGRPELLTSVSVEHIQLATDDAEVQRHLVALGTEGGSLLLVPLRARNESVAVMIIGRVNTRSPFGADDLADAVELGSRAAQAIDTLRLQARQHATSVALQEALLTPAVPMAGIDTVTRYVPAAHHAQVGGDWYDTVTRPDGSHLLVIGDVIGHGNAAAAAMGQLRSIIRTLAYTSDGAPHEILEAADRTAHGLHVSTLATVVLVEIAPGPGRRRMRWSSAGHPSPLLASLDGPPRELVCRHDPLLGARPEVARNDHEEQVGPGDTLLLFTDGLIERRDEDLDVGVRRLLDGLAASRGTSLEATATTLLRIGNPGRSDGRREEHIDDSAILLCRIH